MLHRRTAVILSQRTAHGHRVNKHNIIMIEGHVKIDPCFIADVIVTAAVQFLQNASKSADPFFLFLSFTTPHAGGIGNVKYGILHVCSHKVSL